MQEREAARLERLCLGQKELMKSDWREVKAGCQSQGMFNGWWTAESPLNAGDLVVQALRGQAPVIGDCDGCHQLLLASQYTCPPLHATAAARLSLPGAVKAGKVSA